MKPTARLDLFSDGIEKRLPSWLTYNRIGDPISWVFSHPAWVLVGAKVGAVVGLVQGAGWRLGAVVGAVCVCCVYTFLREPLDARAQFKEHGWAGAWKRTKRNPYCSGVQVGWLADGIGDVAGCWLLAALLWRVLL